jgi:nicotinamidase-related amidase
VNKYTQPNWRSSALITIDTQCDTLDGAPLEIPGTSAILPNIRMVLDAYRRKKMPVVHIVRIYRKDGSNVDLCRKEAVENGAEVFLEGSRGCELAQEMFRDEVKLAPGLLLSGGIQEIGDNEVVIYKPRWGAFYNTQLQSYLDGFSVDTLVFVGSNFPNCPRASIYEASERDLKIVLVEDGISGLYPKAKEEILNIGVRVMKAEAVKKAVAG